MRRSYNPYTDHVWSYVVFMLELFVVFTIAFGQNQNDYTPPDPDYGNNPAVPDYNTPPGQDYVDSPPTPDNTPVAPYDYPPAPPYDYPPAPPYDYPPAPPNDYPPAPPYDYPPPDNGDPPPSPQVTTSPPPPSSPSPPPPSSPSPPPPLPPPPPPLPPPSSPPPPSPPPPSPPPPSPPPPESSPPPPPSPPPPESSPPPPTLDFVTEATGRVFCYRCYNWSKKSKSTGREPLEGAKVLVTCPTDDEPIVVVATSGSDGRYNVTLTGYDYEKYGSKKCEARLLQPPKDSVCDTPTNHNKGEEGAPLKAKSKKKDGVTLKSKSFAYAPEKKLPECEK